MTPFLSNIKKELLLLYRDWVGLLLLFLMPIVLVLLMTNLQDGTTKKLVKQKINIAIVDKDNSQISEAIKIGLDSSKIFNVIYFDEKGNTLTVDNAKKMAENEMLDIALLIPEKSTNNLRKIVYNEISKQQPLTHRKVKDLDSLDNVSFQVYFNPVIKATFRQAMIGRIHELVANIQTQIVFKSYTKFVKTLTGKSNKGLFPNHKIKVEENFLGLANNKSIPNSTQHNVPAWTVFAIFFIVIPLSSQIISEREVGTHSRLETLPGNSISFILPKVLIFSLITLLQASLLLIIGKYILPLMNLPILNFKNHLFDLLVFTFVIGIAATSYGILISVVAKTQHQASIFGSLSIVFLAAIGGVFVPTYIMTDGMLILSKISPLNWAISGYNNIFINGYSLGSLFPQIMKLLLLSLALILSSILIKKR